MGMTDTLRKIFLTGIGAIATTADKAQEVIDDLVKRGEITVEQGKELMNDFTQKTVKPAISFVKKEEFDALAARVEALEKKLNGEQPTE
jgi:polyhydroxyalkanoate synthesis regulator phasin